MSDADPDAVTNHKVENFIIYSICKGMVCQ